MQTAVSAIALRMVRMPNYPRLDLKQQAHYNLVFSAPRYLGTSSKDLKWRLSFYLFRYGLFCVLSSPLLVLVMLSGFAVGKLCRR